MDRDPFTVAHCPGYAPAWRMHHVRKAEHLGADSAALTEAYRVAGGIASRPTAGVVGTSSTDTRAVHSPYGDAGDTPMLVAPGNRITRRHAERVTRPGRPAKYAPERYVCSVTYRLDGTGPKVTHVTAHPSPLFCGRLAWLRVMRAAMAEVRRAKRLRHAVVFTGDLQTRGRLVYGLLRAAGLQVHRVGIDYVCHNKRVRMVGDLEVVHVPGFDHPWLVADLDWTKR